jgi:hypothetical protein
MVLLTMLCISRLSILVALGVGANGSAGPFRECLAAVFAAVAALEPVLAALLQHSDNDSDPASLAAAAAGGGGGRRAGPGCVGRVGLRAWAEEMAVELSPKRVVLLYICMYVCMYAL